MAPARSCAFQGTPLTGHSSAAELVVPTWLRRAVQPGCVPTHSKRVRRLDSLAFGHSGGAQGPLHLHCLQTQAPSRRHLNPLSCARRKPRPT